MTETHISYDPGSWTLVSRGDRSLLVDASAGDPAIARLWSTLAVAADLDALLAQLGEDLPEAGFCLVELRDDRILLAQHGITVRLDGTDVQASRSPEAVAVPAAGGTVIASITSAPPGLRIPFEAGVVAAGALVIERVGDVVPDPVLRPPADATVLEAPDDPADDRGPDAPALVTVLAGLCPHGHLSGAYSPACRVCGDPMPPQEPQTIARPVLGALVLESGERVRLDRGAVLGRAPRTPEDAEAPVHLVDLAGFGRDVSRQHVEILLRGWNVLVRDLGSANGTRLLGPACQATALEPGVLVPLAPGGAIVLADVTTVRFEVSA